MKDWQKRALKEAFEAIGFEQDVPEGKAVGPDEPVVTHMGVFDMQLCTPWYTSDEDVVEQAGRLNPTGLSTGWSIVRTGSRHLRGDAERVQCEDRVGCCHVMLEC